MIKRVIHIADIHLPNDERNRPYSEMLKKFLKQVYDDVKDYKQDEVRIVIVGDIFHNKIKTTNEARALFHIMLNFLNKISNVLIITGNHDMLENNKDRYDSLSPTFDIEGAYENVTYVDKILKYKSGYIIDDNIIWALYSMHDNFDKPNISNLEIDEQTKVIGLYHGEVIGAVTDIGRMSDKGVSGEYFDGCDCVMAGHIHKFQTIKKNGIPIVYSGSLFQQGQGENVSGHGYVIWDIENMSYSHCEVDNDYRTYKFQISSYDDVNNNTERILNL